MNFVLVGGVNYYYNADTVPKFVQHALTLLTNRFGLDLDAGCPPVIRKKALLMMARFGALNV